MQLLKLLVSIDKEIIVLIDVFFSFSQVVFNWEINY